MPSRSRGARASLSTVLFASILMFAPGAALATYTGVQDVTTFGTVAAGGGWIAVPQYNHNSDPGSIDGTPFDDTTSSLDVVRVSGRRRISFRLVAAGDSLTMGPMLVAGAPQALTVAWTDAAGAGQVEEAALNARGDLPSPFVQTSTVSAGSLRLTVGPDGAYAVSWRDGVGTHVVAAPAGAHAPGALLGPGVPPDPAAHVVLSGGNSFWLVKDIAGDLAAAPAVFGQDAAPDAITVNQATHATILGDNAGGLWVLARGNRGLFAEHIDRTGQLNSIPLPVGTTHPVIALAGTTAVIAYSISARCAVYIERLRSSASPHAPSTRTLLASDATCSMPKGIAVDPASATAYVLMRSARGLTLATETAARKTSSWHGLLRGRFDAIVAAGSNHVVVESNGPQRNIGEQCGGASPSFTQLYSFSVFHGAQLERSGKLEASVTNC